MEKKYLIYKITNLLNKKIYIGHHTTNNINDKYMGSGRAIKEAISEFGIDNFEKEIMFIFNSREEMLHKESEIVDDEFRKREDTYNIALGGQGFGMLGVKLSKETCQRMSQSRTGKKRIFSKSHCENLSKSKKGKKQTPEFIEKRIKPLRGRKNPPHSNEVREKMREAHRRNPQVISEERKRKMSEMQRGKIWISNYELQKSKFIPFEDFNDFSCDGWIRGRKFPIVKQETKDKISKSTIGRKSTPETCLKKSRAAKKVHFFKKMNIINSIIHSIVNYKTEQILK